MTSNLIHKLGNVKIHYFSGTGNAKNVANWIGEKIQPQCINLQIKNIATYGSEKIDKKEIQPTEFDNNSLVGFCYPTHGFNAPPIILKYLWNFPRTKNHTKVFVINTRAGLKLSKIFLPGISGLAIILPAIILMLKGYRLVGYRSIDLPSNWISIHPGLKKKVVTSIFTRCKRITDGFSSKILSSKKVHTGFWWLPLDLLLTPIAFGYYLYGRFALSKTFISTANCNSCGLCVENCPVNAITMKDGKPFWSYKCESCMHCMNTCPSRAIETPHLFTALIWWFSFSILPILLVNLLTKINNFKGLFFSLSYDILFLIISISIIFGSYRIMHKLMKYTFINRIIKYTSLTSYSFWRRYMAPKV